MQVICPFNDIFPAVSCTSNPLLLIKDIPQKTVSMVLIAANPDTENYHWVVYNIPVTDVIEENFRKGISAVNDFSRHDFTGPEPGDDDPRLIYAVFALDAVLDIGGGKGGNDILKALTGHIIDFAFVECRYTVSAHHSRCVSPLAAYDIPPGLHD